MVDLDVSIVDSVWLRVQCERGIAKELSDYFTFKVPGYKFMPAYRSRMWNGEICLYNIHTQQIYGGLAEYILKFAEERGYTVTMPAKNDFKITPEDVQQFIEEFLKVCVGGKRAKAHSHQINAVHHAMEKERCLLLSPTGSGKSLIIYALLRYYLDKIPKGKKVLVIVPTVSLVEQMFSDFADYSGENGWDVGKNCHKILSGASKTTDKRVVISTWQSVFKQTEKYFEQFGAVVGDEAHLFKAKSLTSIMTKLKTCPFRVGTTGTLDGTQTHRLVLEGLFGRAYEVTKTKELMEQKILSDLKIDCIVLQYPREDREMAKRAKYQDEIKWIIGSKRRNAFIADMCEKLKGNTLVLFQFVEGHGAELHKLVEERVGSTRKVFFVHGGTEAGEREDIRKIVEQEENAVIIASYGTFSTGISIRRLNNILFASPSKSRIRVLQSIGRQLRVSEHKSVARLFDIGDDLSWRSWVNHTMRHMNERLKIYESEGFTYRVVKVDIGDKKT
jgi:superfamily II DNA or RNA helicase